MDNIRIGRRDASDDEVLSAARLACCDEFVCKMPQGYQEEFNAGNRRSGRLEIDQELSQTFVAA
jgi:ABC-type multidrug transport system fused ATPase/permease subunit